MTIIQQDWNGSLIGFTTAATTIGKFDIPATYVNVTEMCKSNNRDWFEYKRLNSTNDFLIELQSDLGKSRYELIIVISGGNNTQQGTWVHHEIAIDLASWINVRFRVWVNRAISKLIQMGSVSLDSEGEELASEMGLDVLDKHVRAMSALMRAREKGHKDIAQRLEQMLNLDPQPTIATPASDIPGLFEFLNTQYVVTANHLDYVVANELKYCVKRFLKDYDVYSNVRVSFIERVIVDWFKSHEFENLYVSKNEIIDKVIKADGKVLRAICGVKRVK